MLYGVSFYILKYFVSKYKTESFIDVYEFSKIINFFHI